MKLGKFASENENIQMKEINSGENKYFNEFI